MNQKVLYSMMGLAALPMGAEAAVVQDFVVNDWNGSGKTIVNGAVVSDGSELTYALGKLLPGHYTFTCDLTTTMYAVKINIGTADEFTSSVSDDVQKITIEFELTAETDVNLSLVTTGKANTIGAGAEFTVGNPKIELSDADITAGKTALAAIASAAKTTIDAYTYKPANGYGITVTRDVSEDKTTIQGYVTEISGLEITYANYKNYSLYATEESAIKTQIDDLLSKAKDAQDAYNEYTRRDNNNTAFNTVAEAINTMKVLIASAKADLKDNVLVDVAAYLSPDAEGELDALNEILTNAVTANSANKSKYADEGNYTDAEVKAIIEADDFPTTAKVNAIVSNYTSKAIAANTAYSALEGKVAMLKDNLDNVTIDAKVASQFTVQKKEAQDAINAIDAKVKAIKGKFDPADIDISVDVTDAQGLIDDLEADAAFALDEYDANAATTAAIGVVQGKLIEAKNAIEDKNYGDTTPLSTKYATLLSGYQEQINDWTAEAADAYEKGKAQEYNASFDTSTLTANINTFKTNALAAHANYEALTADVPVCQDDIAELRTKYNYNKTTYDSFKGADKHPYDFKTNLNQIQKRVNDLEEDFADAMAASDNEHWTKMSAANEDCDNLLDDLEEMRTRMAKSMNYYNATYLFGNDEGSGKALEDKIATDEGLFTSATLGDYYTGYVADQKVIKDALADLKNTIAGTEAYSETIGSGDDEANTADVIAGWENQISQFDGQQTSLEEKYNDTKDDLSDIRTTKDGIATAISNLQTQLNTFETTYLGDTPTTDLGLRKVTVATTESGIKTDLSTLKTNVGNVGTDNLNLDRTDKVKTSENDWKNSTISSGYSTVSDMIQYQGTATGNVLQQTVTGLPDGTYDVEIFAFGETGQGAVKVYAGSKDKSVSLGETRKYTIENVEVTNGTLEIGLTKNGNQDKKVRIKFESLKATTESVLAVYNDEYTKIAESETDLERTAAQIASDVAANKAKKAVVDTELANLGTFETNTLKSQAVTDANGNYDMTKATKTLPTNPWYLFKSDLDDDDTYEAKKTAIDARISALETAVNSSFSAEKLVADWNDGIGDNTITSIKEDINKLLNDIQPEVDNWNAYKDAYDEVVELDAAIAEVEKESRKVLYEKAGSGAQNYYKDVFDGYIDERDELAYNVTANVKDRTAVSAKSGNINAADVLTAKVNSIITEAEANSNKYKDQKAAWTATQNAWNDAYATIAGRDNYKGDEQEEYKSREDYLKELNQIQEEIDQAGLAVESYYSAGKSVAKATEVTQEFTTLNSNIESVLQAENENFIPAVAAENLKYHNTFIAALEGAKAQYTKAVKALSDNSASNEDIADAIFDLTSGYAGDLSTFSSDLSKLENDEKAAYDALDQAPGTIFTASAGFTSDAVTLETDILNRKTQFLDDVATVVNNFWKTKRGSYSIMVVYAEGAISGYDASAQQDAFKDVNDILTEGDNAKTLKAVEQVMKKLENIDDMLKADKNKAAYKDLLVEYGKLNIDGIDGDRTKVEAYGDYADSEAFEDEVAKVNAAYKQITEDNEELFDKHNVIKKVFTDYTAKVKQILQDAQDVRDYDIAYHGDLTEMNNALAKANWQYDQATEVVNGYRYTTSFSTIETSLDGIKGQIEAYAVRNPSEKSSVLSSIATQKDNILSTLKDAFSTEKAGLNTDLKTIKGWYNNYVAEFGLDAAKPYKDQIDEVTAGLAASIADNATFEEALEAAEALLETQATVIELYNTLGSAENANVMATLTQSIGTLRAKVAEFNGMDSWVGEQIYVTTTLDEVFADFEDKIEALETELEGHTNDIAYFKKNYEDKVGEIDDAITPALTKAKDYQAQVDADTKAYPTMKSEIEAYTGENGKIKKAKNTVAAFEFAEKYDYSSFIDEAESLVTTALANLETAHGKKNSQNFVFDSEAVDAKIALYLDKSANAEIGEQIKNLNLLLGDAVGENSKYYSAAQWGKVMERKKAISDQIDELDESAGYEKYDIQMGNIENIETQIEALSSTVEDMVLLNGNANGDDRVDVLDYQLVSNWILGSDAMPKVGSDLFVVSDVNENKTIEVGDLTGIVNIILNKQWTGEAWSGVKGFNEFDNECVNMTVSSNQNGTQRIAITLNNFRDYTAFQLDLKLPEGMTIVGKDLTERAADSHNLLSRTQQDGSVRFLASSLLGEIFSGNEGAVLYVDVKMGASYQGGEIQVNNILFSDVTATSHGFVLGDDATDIATVGTLENLRRQVYDLGGKLMNGLRKGINIIRNADGTVEKRMVK